jgi:peptide-O-fucosyltransferase
MKEGNPFESFWNELNVSFVDTETYQLNYDQYSIPQWHQLFPANRYPVLALKGAPASFPMSAEHRQLQKYMNWSQKILDEVRQHQTKLFNNEPYIGR